MSVKKKSQIAFDDNVVSNSEVLELLLIRHRLSGSYSEYKKADKAVKEAIEKLDASPPFRIGEFWIERKHSKGRHVEFDTQDKSRVSISSIVDDSKDADT